MAKVKISSVEEALMLLENAVAEKGADYKAPKYNRDENDRHTIRIEQNDSNQYSGAGACRYFTPDGKHSDCIVGNVLAQKGLTAEDAAKFEGEVAGAMSLGNVVEAPSAVWSVLRAAQAVQDNNGTWGEALDRARRMATQLSPA